MDSQSPTAEIRRGKKERKKKEKKPQDKNIMFASAAQGGHNNVHLFSQRHMSLEVRCHGSVLVAWSVSTVKKVSLKSRLL